MDRLAEAMGIEGIYKSQVSRICAEIDEVVVGNIAGPADAANIGRVIALEAKLPRRIPAYTVNRNCASGIQSVVDAAYRIRSGDADAIASRARHAARRSRLPIGA